MPFSRFRFENNSIYYLMPFSRFRFEVISCIPYYSLRFENNFILYLIKVTFSINAGVRFFFFFFALDKPIPYFVFLFAKNTKQPLNNNSHTHQTYRKPSHCVIRYKSICKPFDIGIVWFYDFCFLQRRNFYFFGFYQFVFFF